MTNAPADNCQLNSIAVGAKEALGVRCLIQLRIRAFSISWRSRSASITGATPHVPEQNRHRADYVKKTGIPTRKFASDKFVHDKDTDTFVCPAGSKLEFSYLDRAHDKKMRVYCTDACFSCEFFLTKSTRYKWGRTVGRCEHAEVVEEMRERMRFEPEQLAERKKIVENPFGTMKRAFNQGCLLLMESEKGYRRGWFTMLVYNMRRVLNLL